MMCVLRLLFVLLLLPALVWSQTQVVNGNRVQAGWINYGTTAGTATAYTLTFTPPLPGYVQGQCFLLKPHVANTGAATLNVQGKGALALTKQSGGSLVPLVAGDLPLGRLVMACHDGTALQLMGTAPDAGGVADGDKTDITVSSAGTVWTIDTSAVTYAKMQNVSTTQRLLGRNTAGSGPIEEVTPAQIKAMLGMTFGDITGTASDAQILDLNTLSTGLTPSRCVETATDGKLAVAAGPCGSGGGGLTDGDKQDISVSGSGTIWTIDPGVVTYTKMQNVSTTARILGRNTAGAGPIEELPTGTVKTMLGLNFGDLTGTASDAQILDLNTLSTGLTPSRCVQTDGTGKLSATAGVCAAAGVPDGDKQDITVSGSGTIWTIDPGTVTYTKMQNVSQNARLLGRNTVGAGPMEELAPGTVQTMLGYEVTTNKDANASLGTDNNKYPTQGAVKAYVDSTPKTMSNTEVLPRHCALADATPVTINRDTCNTVHIAELSQATTFAIPTFTLLPTQGQFLSISIYTTQARALTFTTGANGYSAENGIPLPTTTLAGGYVLYGFRWNSQSSRWAFVATTQFGAGGTVDVSGTPVAGQLATWTDANTLAGTNALSLQVTTVDFGGATTTIPHKTGTTPPGSCAPGETFFDTDAAASGKLYACHGGVFVAQGGGVAGGTGFVHLPVSAAQLPATVNSATIDSSETNMRLLFDASTPQCAWWQFRMPLDYVGSPVLKWQYSMLSATGAVGISLDVSVMAVTPGDAVDINNEANYAAVNNCDQTPVPATLGSIQEISCPLTNNDGLAANDYTKIKVCRATGDAVDNAGGMMEGVAAHLEYAR